MYGEDEGKPGKPIPLKMHVIYVASNPPIILGVVDDVGQASDLCLMLGQKGIQGQFMTFDVGQVKNANIRVEG